MLKIRLFALFAILLGLLIIYSKVLLQVFTIFHDSNKIQLLIRSNPPNDNFTHCLLEAHRALANLSLPWFLAFGTALMYYRSNNFVSGDIDIGIFIDDLKRTNTTDTKFVLTIRNYDFKLLVTYGNMTHGQGWTLRCPRSKVRFGVFVFYHADPIENKTFAWWTASYNGLCNNMRYRKCRWWFSDFKPDTFKMYGQLFYIAPKQFLIEQYGNQWMSPRKYGYFESLKFLPNLIDEH